MEARDSQRDSPLRRSEAQARPPGRASLDTDRQTSLPIDRSQFANESLTNVLNRLADPIASCIYVGPTAFDYSMLSGPLVPPSESKLMAQWKERDLSAYYSELRSNRRSA